MKHLKLFSTLFAILSIFSFTACIGHDESISGETGSLNGHEWVDMGLGVKWATCNVGANNPWEAGEYFAWGDTVSKEEYTMGNCSAWDKGLDNIAGNVEYDAARAKWGSGWRMPTFEEMKELRDNCTWKYSRLKGVPGYWVTGFTGNSIFLPFAGYYNGSAHYDDNVHGCYWSSASYSAHSAYCYFLDEASCKNFLANTIVFGCSVRPVLE